MAEGHFEAARTELETAVELDPFSWAILDNAIWALELTGNYQEVLAMTDRALQAGRADGSSHLGRRKVVALMALGRREEAVKIAQEMAAKTSGSVSNRILALADVGLKAEAEALLPQISDDGMKTRALAALGHYEESIASFNTSLLTQPALSVFFYERWFDPIREDPRVVKVLATVGMTEAHARVQAWRAAHPPEKAKGKP